MAYASIPTGAVTLFNQAAAPVKWTRSTAYDDYTLRIVTGTPSTGGSNPFKTVNTINVTFGGGSYSYTSITTGPTAAPVPNHSHPLVSVPSTNPLGPVNHYYYANVAGNSNNAGNAPAYASMSGAAINQSGANGSSTAHNHTFTASPNFGPFAAPTQNFTFSLAYIDNILATRTG
jgi:hypothetical protein